MKRFTAPQRLQLRQTRAFHEYHDQVLTARNQKRICLGRVSDLKKTCAAKCGRQYIADCVDCYSEVLEVMRQRYRESPPGAEWFHQKPGFLNSLDSLFSEAMEQQASPAVIEPWIIEQKKLWYRAEVASLERLLAVASHDIVVSPTALTGNPAMGLGIGAGLGASSGSGDKPPFPSDEFLRLALQGEGRIDELADLVWALVGRPDKWWPCLDGLPVRWRSAGGYKPQTGTKRALDGEPKEAYVDMLLRNQSRGGSEMGEQKWIGEYLGDGNATIVGVVDQLLLAHNTWMARNKDRDQHQRRLDELRRGAAAVTQKKDRLAHSAKTRPPAPSVPVSENSSDAANFQAQERLARVAGDKYRLPACHSCAGPIDVSNVISCSLCQVFVELRFPDAVMTVYCSNECCDRAHDGHIELAHECEAGESCVLKTYEKHEPTKRDDSVHGGNEATIPVLCADCVGSLCKKTVYCSRSCAQQHLRRHLEAVHPSSHARVPSPTGGGAATTPDPQSSTRSAEDSGPMDIAENGPTAPCTETTILDLGETLERAFAKRNPGASILGKG